VRHAAGRLDLRARRVRAGEGDVLRDGAVEEEVVLEDDAEVAAVVPEADRGEVVAVDEDAPPRAGG
jgi:hypothetical protein